MSRPRTRADKVAIRPTPNLTTLSDSLLRCCAGRRLRSHTPMKVPARMKQRQVSATINGFWIKRLSFGFRAFISNYWSSADGAMRQLKYRPGCRIDTVSGVHKAALPNRTIDLCQSRIRDIVAGNARPFLRRHSSYGSFRHENQSQHAWG